jgi:tripartite-type tricarboxylate transporter receptor subunit TctC
MQLARRNFLHLVMVIAALSAAPCLAMAQAYPTRPVRLVVGVTAGGANDTVARLVAQSLSERLGEQVVVENRPGAGGAIATEGVAKAAPDGYTLLFVTSANAIGASLVDRPGFKFIRDIEPIASLVRGPLIMDVNPSFPAKTIPEFIAYAKAHPGKINMASAGIGNTTHVVGVLFQMLTGTKFTHVPYRGGAPAVTDLLAGQVQHYFDGVSGSLHYVKSGKLRALGVTTASRAAVLPDVPAIGEFVPGYEAGGWYGIGAPKNTPIEIVNKLNKEINACLADDKLKKRLADLGYATFVGSPADFGAHIARETKKWAEVLKFAGVK